MYKYKSFNFLGLGDKIFNRLNFTKILIIFFAGLISRYMVNSIFEINVFSDFTNYISYLYYFFFSVFVALVHNFVDHFGIPSFAIDSFSSINKIIFLYNNINNIKFKSFKLFFSHLKSSLSNNITLTASPSHLKSNSPFIENIKDKVYNLFAMKDEPTSNNSHSHLSRLRSYHSRGHSHSHQSHTTDTQISHTSSTRGSRPVNTDIPSLRNRYRDDFYDNPQPRRPVSNKSKTKDYDYKKNNYKVKVSNQNISGFESRLTTSSTTIP